MGFATVQAYIDNMRTQVRYRSVNKIPGTQVVNVPYTYWRLGGMPVAGATPTAGLGGAVACNKDTVGSIETTNAPAGQRNFLARFRVDRASALTTIPGTYLICDRLAHANITNNQATGNFSPVIDATARLNAGEGGMIFMEVTTALSAASNTRTFTYTNQSGTTGRVTENIVTVASAVVDRVPYADFLWVPLLEQDRGVRSIESTTLVAGTATGNYTVSIVRPLAWINQTMFALPNEREFGLQKQYLDELRDGSCLFIIQIPTTIQTAVFQGGLSVVSG